MSGPGRPSTGVKVQVRIPADLLAVVDAQAAERGVSRAEMMRRCVEIALDRLLS